ncbi:MAG: hypothetical protein PHY47_20630 [Lachnospiraceae bacterium]|nr:hypothetical protein [Lachnospiraceae bacterium]
MFLNSNILKKLMKQAYKRGLVIAQTEKRYYIAGGYWEMDVKKEFLPKTILAQIIELAGEVPDVGERFRATKDGNQIEFEMPIEVDARGFENDIEITQLILISKGVHQRILQSPQTGDVKTVNNVFVEIADNTGIEKEKGEYRVEKPLYHDVKGILWANNVARLRAGFRYDEAHKRILEEITQIDITEDPVE